MDLFEHQEQLPRNVHDIVDKWADIEVEKGGLSYDDCQSFVCEIEPLGYTFDYYLDAVPYNLRKIM